MSGKNKKTKKNSKALVSKVFIPIFVVAIVCFSAIIFAYNNSSEPTSPVSSGFEPDLLDLEDIGEVKGVSDSVVINDNIFINSIDVSDLTKTEAEDLLKEKLSKDFSTKKIIFSVDGTNLEIPLDELGVTYAIPKSVELAYSYTRNSNGEVDKDKVKSLKQKKYEIDMPIEYNNEKLDLQLNEITQTYNVPAVEPKFERIDGEFSVSKEEYGKKINIEQAREKVVELISKGNGGEIELVFEEAAPKYSSAEFSKATNLLGTFTTYFTAGSNGRNTNINTSTNKINDTVLMPGEVFSTNKMFGAMTHDNGYRLGGTIVNGKLEDGYGGGVCQVSSTLYTALLYSELEIVERMNHSLRVGYMDWGFDATLAGDYIDLKFKNNTQYPVTVEGFTTGTSVTINIYGYETRSPGRKLVFENALVQTNPPAAENIKEDSRLPLGQRAVDIPARTGYVYSVYKLVYQDNAFVEKVKINTSTYRSTRAEIRVGTGPAAPPTENPEIPTDENGETINPTSTETSSQAVENNVTNNEIPADNANVPNNNEPVDSVPVNVNPTEDIIMPSESTQRPEELPSDDVLLLPNIDIQSDELDAIHDELLLP